VLTVLSIYHAGFALLYLSSLRIVSRCRRHVERLKEEISNGNISDEDVRAWNGIGFKMTNWLAWMRYVRSRLYETRIGWEWAVDLFIDLTHP
jgi:hypothetical protein